VVDVMCLVWRKVGLFEAIQNPLDEVSIGRRALRINDAAGLMVIPYKVGEGPADIDGDGI